MEMNLTQHARSRLQQRGIPLNILEPLLTFGHEEHDHRGGAVVYFNHRAKERLRRTFGKDIYKRMEPHLDAYAVIARDGAIITVGHRTQRINRN